MDLDSFSCGLCLVLFLRFLESSRNSVEKTYLWSQERCLALEMQPNMLVTFCDVHGLGNEADCSGNRKLGYVQAEHF